MDKVWGEPGLRGIGAVRLQDGTVTNDPKVVVKEELNSFKRQHNAGDREFSDYTENLISHLPKLYNETQRRNIQGSPFNMPEPDESLHKLKPRKTPGVDGLPAELYRTLPLNLKRHLTARLSDIAIERTDIPPDWANLVQPLYKKGDWANPDNSTPIVCATTEGKLIWMLILKRVALVVYRAIPPVMWRATPGRSPLEAILFALCVPALPLGHWGVGSHHYAGHCGGHGPHKPHHHVPGRQKGPFPTPHIDFSVPSGSTCTRTLRPAYRGCKPM